jgi:hypothetical protein
MSARLPFRYSKLRCAAMHRRRRWTAQAILHVSRWVARFRSASVAAGRRLDFPCAGSGLPDCLRCSSIGRSLAHRCFDICNRCIAHDRVPDPDCQYRRCIRQRRFCIEHISQCSELALCQVRNHRCDRDCNGARGARGRSVLARCSLIRSPRDYHS